MERDQTYMSAWLRCSLTEGMFPGEYAVELDTSEAGRISLFAPAEKVRFDDRLVRVDVLESSASNGNAIYVYLPSSPFEISSRTVKVPRTALVPMT
jgi:hypothetical protein